MRLTNTCRYSEDGSTGETTVYLPDELKVALERLARLLGRGESALTREVIEDKTGLTLPLFSCGEPGLA